MNKLTKFTAILISGWILLPLAAFMLGHITPLFFSASQLLVNSYSAAVFSKGDWAICYASINAYYDETSTLARLTAFMTPAAALYFLSCALVANCNRACPAIRTTLQDQLGSQLNEWFTYFQTHSQLNRAEHEKENPAGWSIRQRAIEIANRVRPSPPLRYAIAVGVIATFFAIIATSVGAVGLVVPFVVVPWLSNQNEITTTNELMELCETPAPTQ